MKTLFFLAFFLPLPAIAEKPLPADFSFRCVSTMPTTSFLGEAKGTNFELTVIHHNGTPYMPIHRGIVVPNDFRYLKEKADALTRMGDRQVFQFPLERCRLFAPTRFSCSGNQKQNFGGIEMEAMHFLTTRIVEESYEYTFERTRAELSLLVPGMPVQEIPMEYYQGECRFGTGAMPAGKGL